MKNAKNRLEKLEQKANTEEVHYYVCWCVGDCGNTCQCECHKATDKDTVVKVVYWDDEEEKQVPITRSHPTTKLNNFRIGKPAVCQ